MSATRSNPRKLSPSRNNHVLRDSPKTADFDPRNMQTPLKVWCRSDLGAVLNGSDVSKWLDMSGNGSDFAQTTAADQPAFQQSGQGGRPEISWDDHRMVGGDFYAMMTDKGEWTIVGVFGKGWSDFQSNSAFQNSPNALTANPSVGQMGFGPMNSDGFGGGIYNAGYSDSVAAAGTIGAVGDPVVAMLFSDSGGIKSRQNGAAGSTAAARDLTSIATTLRLGDIADNGRADEFYDGPMSELMIFDGTLQSYEMTQIEQYVSDRYNFRTQ